ncbi:hypothetical protein SAMN04487970_104529 [Paenibacillus tianmuensis]|uniref:Tetratricopeptide repeat-containing protein n=1 Tax=Paenibacillus tianmuensis TaxID=624147 RepID=A0A1G4T8S7_9BACL|nr:DUF6483 family protein [Paenibacillus tianmuensis]SCW77812.1 hypothetical protein SAMN04487970_104529 [Paenibacillus tianmuensis]
MYKRDYILRMIEQAVEMLHKVMFHRRNQQLREAMELLNQAMRQLLGVGSKLVHALSVKDLLALLSKDGEVDQGKVLVCGDMLNAQAALHADSGEEAAARAAAAKSLELLLTARELDARDELREEFTDRIESALALVGRAPMSASLLKVLIPYYEASGRYGRAEDATFHLLDELERTKETEERLEQLGFGIRMYERWLGLDSAALVQGNLSKEEVEDGLNELIRIKKSILEQG